MFCEITGPCKSVGPSHTIHLRVDGSAFGIGRNNFGQLGDGSQIHATKPVLCQTEKPVTKVSVGGWHSLFLRNDGHALAVGKNHLGQLGDGTTSSRVQPRRILMDIDRIMDSEDIPEGDVIAISAGYQHSLFLKRDGTAWVAGGNECGQLGLGDFAFRTKPTKVLENVTAISAGESHSLFVRYDGTVWGAGCNEFGQLGDSSTVAQVRTSQATIDEVASVIAGQHKSLFIKTDGTVWASGQVDDSIGYIAGPDWPRSTPVQVARKLDDIVTPEGSVTLEEAVLGMPVYATDQRFPLDDPYYAQGLPSLAGLGFTDFNYR